MIILLTDPAVTEGATSSLRAIALYGIVVVSALLSIGWKQEIGLYLLTLLLPLQTTRYHLHAFPFGANIVDILLLSSICGALIRPAAPLARRSVITRFLAVMAVFYYLSLWRGSFFLGSPMPLWFDNGRLVDYKNIMVMPLLTLAALLIVRTRRQIAIILLLCSITAAAVDESYSRSAAGRNFGHYSEQTRDAGPLGYAGENGLASYMVEITCGLIPLLALKKHTVSRLLLLLLVGINISCILFSYSREAYLALAAALCFLAVLRLRLLLVPLVLLGLAWQVVLPTAVQERMTMTYSHPGDAEAAQLDSSAQERVTLWTDAMTLFHDNPVFGSGFLTYSHMGRVGSYKDTHNFYLKLLVETGIVGLVLFLLQLLLFFREGFLLFRGTRDPFLSLFGLGFAALVLAAAVVNIFGDRWLFIQVDSNLWILLGCVLSAASLVQSEAHSSGPVHSAPHLSRRVEGDAFQPVMQRSATAASVSTPA